MLLSTGRAIYMPWPKCQKENSEGVRNGENLYRSGGAARMTPASPLHDNSGIFGKLFSIEPDEDCQIAQIGDCQVVIPQDFDLSSYIGQRIGVAFIDGKFYVQRAEAGQ